MISIVGLRDYLNPKTKKNELIERFREKNWGSDSVAKIFKNPDFFLKSIPKKEHYNLFYTAAHIKPGKTNGAGRQLQSQNIIPFDIDNIDPNQIDETAQIVIETLNLDWENTGIIFSGHGLQVIVGITQAFTDPAYFDQMRPYYKIVCAKIQSALDSEGVPGNVDDSVFKNTQILQMPETENRKKNREPVAVRTINANIEYIDFDIMALSGLPNIDSSDQIDPDKAAKFPAPDKEAILKECLFLKGCKDNAKNLSEPEWYAALSIFGRFKDGREFAHEVSRAYPGYSYGETEAKITHALEASGPRTCGNINSIWGKCHQCSHMGTRLKSPILIKGKDYIASKEQGFYEYQTDHVGRRKRFPAYRDLKKYLEQTNMFITVEDSKMVYKYNGTHWVEMYPQNIKQFAENNFFPPASEHIRKEFLNLIYVSNLRQYKWFASSRAHKINLKNGVYDLKTKVLSKHSPEYGFRYCLPYDYDPCVKAPRFEKFLWEITLGRDDLIDILTEFMGYAFSGDACWIHKALFLYGATAKNGKSTFLDILKMLAGENNFAVQTLGGLNNDANRYEVDGKLFNIAEEAGLASLAESDVFKRMVAGNYITVKKLYSQPYSIENRCKLIVSCNELPRSGDKTDGLYRRMIIVPFEARFDGDEDDKHIKNKLSRELSGIFNLAIKGYERLHKQQNFTQSKAVEIEMEKYKEENDNVIHWRNERVIVRELGHPEFDETFVLKEELYIDYKGFVLTGGQKPLSRIQFFKQIKRVFPYCIEKRRNYLDKRPRVVIGCKLEHSSSTIMNTIGGDR